MCFKGRSLGVISSILSVNYYDNYDFLGNFAHGNDSLSYKLMTGYDSRYIGPIAAQSAKGLLTGTATRVLGDSIMLVKSLYYDSHGNVIQSHENNAVGGYEHEYLHLTFTGKPLAIRHEHSCRGITHVDINTMTYDAMERLLTTTVTHDNDQVDVITNTYDDLGRLATQSCLNGQQTTAYSYNIRGWLTFIDSGDGKMRQWLHYADAVLGNTPCYNGNISAMDWNTNITSYIKRNRYCYSYDGMNRLTGASYSLYYPAIGALYQDENYSTSYTYDLNSNLTSLQRYGKNELYSVGDVEFFLYGLIDNLTITRDGNQLKKVTDQCPELTFAGAMDFKDYGGSSRAEYLWDANGNMTKDLNKGITNITYNVLNLPEMITHSDGHVTYITYAADGRKLNVTYKINRLMVLHDPLEFPGGFSVPLGELSEPEGKGGGDQLIPGPGLMDPETVIMSRDYCGNYIYRNGAIERILIANGFLQDSAYYVQLKDYQGNVRTVLNQNGTVVERNSYYPYGGLIDANESTFQPYKYSSKELDRENGLDLYDSQARWYDPMLPQTTTQDPLAEKYYSISPYTWCAGNPVNRIDPNGKEAWVLVWATQSKDQMGNTRVGHTGVVVENFNSSFVSDGTYTYYDLWPSAANLGGKAAVQDVEAVYNTQPFYLSINGIKDTNYSTLENYMSGHDISQLPGILQFNIRENSIDDYGEGYAPDGIIRLGIDGQETYKLQQEYKSLIEQGCPYNGESNNCTTFVAKGINNSGVGSIKEEWIIDWKGLLINFNPFHKSFTPNNTYNQLKNRPHSIIIKDAGNKTNESYEDAIIDR